MLSIRFVKCGLIFRPPVRARSKEEPNLIDYYQPKLRAMHADSLTVEPNRPTLKAVHVTSGPAALNIIGCVSEFIQNLPRLLIANLVDICRLLVIRLKFLFSKERVI